MHSGIERRRGDTYADRVIVTNSVGTPIDITGCTFKMTLDTKPDPVDSTTRLYQLVGVVVDAAKGIVEFAPTALQANTVGIYYFDIQMTDSGSRVRTIQTSSYTYKQNITKS